MVIFTVGSVTLGSAILSGGSATWSGTPTTENGFTVGSDTVTASYTPATGSGFIASSGMLTQPLTVTAPAYTITPSMTSVSLSHGGSQPVTLTLASTTFKDSVAWTATTSSPLITLNQYSGTATLSANGSSTVNLIIMASNTAANHAPRLPWSGELIAFGAVLAGVPLAGRFKRRVAAVLLSALAVVTLAFMMACGGGAAPRNYTVTFTGTGGVSSTIAVSVH
jgi:hypothetical protein